MIDRKNICFLFFFLFAFIPDSQSVSAQDHPERVIALDREAYREVTGLGIRLNPDKVLQNGLLRAYLSKGDYEKLRLSGIPFHELPIPSFLHAPVMRFSIKDPDTTWDFYPTYTAYESLMYQFMQEHPGICRIESFDTLSSGRRLLAAVISDNVDSVEAEPKFLYTSSMHGDEIVGYILMLRLIDHLLAAYGNNPEVTNLVNGSEIWINPLANPDGTYAAGNHTVAGATRGNANYIDINRNFPDPQDGPHPDGYPWQEETLAFMELADKEGFNISCNIHGGAEVCNYPWDTWSRLPADNSWWVYVCNQYADTAQANSPPGYLNDFGSGVTNGYAWYSINGGRQDYMNYFHHCREFTLEISNAKLPPANQLPAFWGYNFRSLLNYMEESLYGLRGEVRDSLSGTAVKAQVSIQGHDMDSSEVYSSLPHGNYHRFLFAGTYDISFSAPGYHTRTFNNISVFNGQATYLDAKLLPLQSSINEAATDAPGLRFDPATSYLHITGFSGNPGRSRVEVYSISGNKVSEFPAGSGPFSLSHLAPGSYIAVLHHERGISRCKLILPN